MLQSGRLCVAVPSSEAQPKGLVLGGSSAAGVLYVEPQAAVPLNNELAAACGEAYAAVENVLWRLTGLIADAVEDVQQALDTVSPSSSLVGWFDFEEASIVCLAKSANKPHTLEVLCIRRSLQKGWPLRKLLLAQITLQEALPGYGASHCFLQMDALL